MHIAFIAYGIKDEVDIMFRDMQSQKFSLKMYSPEGEIEKTIPIQGSLRYLPFGIYEYVFPKEHADIVMTTLRFHEPLRYNINTRILNYIRKTLNLEPVPENFDKKTKYPWIMDFVNIIPLGIRMDAENIKEVTG